MLSLADLSYGPGPGERVFTWQHPVTKVRRAWATDRLRAHLVTAGQEVCKAEVDPAQAKFKVQNRGIENARLQRWLQAPVEQLLRPLIMMYLPPDAPGEAPSHLCLSGNHQYVALSILGSTYYAVYSIDEATAEPFEIHDIPQSTAPLPIDGYSGL